MAVSDIERKRWEVILDEFMDRRRPPPDVRAEMDLGYRIEGQSVEVFEIRPFWRDPSRKMEAPVAKATFVRSRNCWRVFWMRRDLKWHRYDPRAEVGKLEDFLAVVDRDEHACFFG
jgi:hypothetical protein